MRIVRTTGRGSLSDSARGLAESGVAVFPCRPGGKAPLTPHGFHDATTERERVRNWWVRWPTANIGTPTGMLPGLRTFDVLDVDVKGEKSGLATLETLRLEGLLVGAVAEVRTPSGGLHLYFGATHRATQHRGDLGLDYQAVGAYVLVPPSVVNGRPYVLERARCVEALEFEWAEVGRLFPAVGSQLSAPARAPRTRRSPPSRSLARLVSFVLGLLPGERNTGFFWAVCRAVEDGHGDLTPLIRAGLRVGMSRHEIEKSVRSARARAKAS